MQINSFTFFAVAKQSQTHLSEFLKNLENNLTEMEV